MSYSSIVLEKTIKNIGRNFSIDWRKKREKQTQCDVDNEREIFAAIVRRFHHFKSRYVRR
jgi:glucan phosphorylase